MKFRELQTLKFDLMVSDIPVMKQICGTSNVTIWFELEFLSEDMQKINENDTRHRWLLFYKYKTSITTFIQFQLSVLFAFALYSKQQNMYWNIKYWKSLRISKEGNMFIGKKMWS